MKRIKIVISVFAMICMIASCRKDQVKTDQILESGFVAPPDHAKPRVYWWWLYNRVTKEGITRDLEAFKAKGISGVNLICTGGYAGEGALPGVEWLGDEWRELFRFTVKEAKRLNIELGFNLGGGWTMLGPWVTQDNAMKKVVQSELKVTGGRKIAEKLKQPDTVEGYYHDISVQAFRMQDDGKNIAHGSVVDLTALMKPDGLFEWDVPEGKWVILRTGYTLTGHPWSQWFAYPKGDTFEGGAGYEIDYLSVEALEEHFRHLGDLVIKEARDAGGELAYLWSDSWECGKLTWTQDFRNQFQRFRGYDLMPYMPVLSGYIVYDSLFSARFMEDYNRTIQDCIAENFYGRFAELCHRNGLKVGNEAGGPNDIPPQDALKNLGRCDIPSGEFWVKYNTSEDKYMRTNLKQTATAAHIYGKSEAQAESFTQMEQDRTHWSIGPNDMKPYANDAFCEGINRIMLHQATCQPPSDGKPGYEFCAGQHFTPNITWWEQSSAFFTFLSRCQYMLQQGLFTGDVCFYLGERTPTLAPPKYVIPSLGSGYDCDYSNAEVLLTRMNVNNGRITLPDGMSYRLLVLQNCVSPCPEICDQVGRFQQLNISSEPSTAMSLEVIEKLRQLIADGATVIGAPPQESAGLKGYPDCDQRVREIAAEIWGDLDGVTRTERQFGKGRIIWGKSPREVLLADGVSPDFRFPDQDTNPDKFDYIHRSAGETEIYFVINRTDRPQSSSFTFRVSGRQPEIWDPVSGIMRDADAFQQADGCTTLPLHFESFESYFVVFRKPISTKAMGKSKENFSKFIELTELAGPWKVNFDPLWGGSGDVEFTQLTNWIDHSEDGIKYYSGTALYKKTFDMPGNKDEKNRDLQLFLDLGNVKHVAEVRLNGKKLGILWCAPWRVNITGLVKNTGNELEIDVINLWANRVIGDFALHKEKRFTKTHDRFRFDMLRGSTPLVDSGLLGPVKILEAESRE